MQNVPDTVPHPAYDSSAVVGTLNRRAHALCQALIERVTERRIVARTVAEGTLVVDLGIDAPGGLAAGVSLAEVCLAGLGRVQIVPGRADVWSGPAVTVETDHPLAACMASQYAGWQIKVERYFAMGSGPMRAAAGKESLFDVIGFRERPEAAVGILETGTLPPGEVCARIAAESGVEAAGLTLLCARTASLAGTIQVVARSVETCLHKLHELGFDLARVVSGFGVAPLPPVAGNDLAALGRTNDAILYGGEVTLWVRGDDESLTDVGPRVPSSVSTDFGRPFIEIFEHYGRDFYRIDRLLFSPAAVTLMNLDTGRIHRFGQVVPEVLGRSFTD